jgi:hypothetical protein
LVLLVLGLGDGWIVVLRHEFKEFRSGGAVVQSQGFRHYPAQELHAPHGHVLLGGRRNQVLLAARHHVVHRRHVVFQIPNRVPGGCKKWTQ